MTGVMLVLALAAGLQEPPAIARTNEAQKAAACRASKTGDLTPDSVPACGPDVTLPRPTKERRPQYPSNAMRERVQGWVEMEVVVKDDGKVGAVRMIKTLHPELDEAAIEAVRQWEFEPAKRAGKAIPVMVNIEMTFRLR